MPNVECAAQNANQHKKKASARRRVWGGNVNAIYDEPGVGWQGEKKKCTRKAFIVEDLGWFSFKLNFFQIYVILTEYKLPSGS